MRNYVYGYAANGVYVEAPTPVEFVTVCREIEAQIVPEQVAVFLPTDHPAGTIEHYVPAGQVAMSAHRTMARASFCLVPGGCPDPETGMPCNECHRPIPAMPRKGTLHADRFATVEPTDTREWVNS